MGCYCAEREHNPAVAVSMQDLPPGFCGRCDVCGRPGHTRAHPSLPTTGAWCDEHWQALLTGPSFSLDRLVLLAILGLLALTAGTALYRMVF